MDNLTEWKSKIDLAIELNDKATITNEVKKLMREVGEHNLRVTLEADKAGILTERYLNLAIKKKKNKFNKRRKF